MPKKIPFNKPFFSGKETEYIQDAVSSGKISGNGKYTQRCHEFFEKRYGFAKCLLTTSCTDALEMAAILLDIQPGDEVILPSYTFVSTANAFVLRGAKLIFIDSSQDHPNLDTSCIESLISPRTKAIIVVHYAGNACDMDMVMTIANKHKLYVVEDAAQAIDGYYKEIPLGKIGHLATFSFHETKNIICGEGGMLVINDEKFIERAEIIWEKGTNRAALFRGDIKKYNWVDIGSSFLPSEITSAYLFAQLEKLDEIQQKRKILWSTYLDKLSVLEKFEVSLPKTPNHSSNNYHIFYLICQNNTERDQLINYLDDKEIRAVFHYLPLHLSPFYSNKHDGRALPNSEKFSDCLVRLPLYNSLSESDQKFIIQSVIDFYRSSH